MPRIQQLSPLVVSKIAAGEVIERPASVVKELLENAVDAGSTRIDVDVEQGGIEVIRVVDNGCGIYADDLPLAFTSHATSKLQSADDLFRIGTLGFRGEALASIGGVGQVTLQSRPADEEAGAEVRCVGGEMSQVRPWNGSPGTRLEVRHLFYNTPVRRKFLRTISTEMGHVAETFTRLALSHLTLHWTLRHNGKVVFDVPATAGLLDRIQTFFGTDVRKHLYPVEVQQNTIRLNGFIANPACDRGSAKMQYLFVNGRWIRDRSLSHAVQEAYRGLLMTGRYAVALLFLDMPADQVDVNVHPTKAEVRFREANALHHLIFSATRDRLRAENLTARLQPPSTLAAPKVQESYVEPPPWVLTAPQPSAAALPFVAPLPPPADDLATLEAAPELPSQESAGANGTAKHPVTSPGWSAPNQYRAIQLYNTYLVLETPEGMLVIDQHALHERILFEQWKSRISTDKLESQRLLVPEPIELTAEQAARTLEHREALAALGFEVEDFGGGTILLQTYPALLGQRSPGKLLRVVIDHLLVQERPPSREVLFNNLLSLMACHAAVRAGDRLNPGEIAALIEQRGLADDTHHCPHGRPTSLLFSRQDLERQFGRI